MQIYRWSTYFVLKWRMCLYNKWLKSRLFMYKARSSKNLNFFYLKKNIGSSAHYGRSMEYNQTIFFLGLISALKS